MESRSLESITLADLKRLGEVAAHDRKDFFERRPDRNFLEDRVFAVALCQGAAKHYIDGENGIKDFDVWSFFIKVDEINFPVKRVVNYDFGYAKFGQSDDRPDYVGRRVDCMWREIGAEDYCNPVEVIRQYLKTMPTKTAYELAQKPVILIEPAHLRGMVIWPMVAE